MVPDGMIVTRGDIHEALTRGRYYLGSVEESKDKNVNLAMNVPDGRELGPEVVRKARALEMECYRKMNVYEKTPIKECFEKTKKPPSVSLRLVAKQINTGKEQSLFSATLPLEALHRHSRLCGCCHQRLSLGRCQRC